MNDDKKPWAYTPKTPAEIEQLAWDIEGDRVFGSWNCPPEMISSCFMVVLFLEKEHLEAMNAAKVAHMYEYVDKASPRSVNGYPSFMSARYIDQDDMKKVVARLKEIEAFRKQTAPA
jgi:hypothetical protein